MENTQFTAIFADICGKNGLERYVTPKRTAAFEHLTELMLETNRVMNVTALTTLEKIVPLHYADCLKIADRIPEGATVADVGCGGGFPTLPLAIVRPDLTVVGIDSTDKKVRYVQRTAEALGLSNVRTVATRAEELAQDPAYRESFDAVISRAVARLNVLGELCLPLVALGGQFIAMKGAAGQVELEEAAHGISRLGGEIQAADPYQIHLSNESEERVLIVVGKTTPTPREFPRPFGNIKKKPL